MNQVEIFNRIINERKRQDILHPNNNKADYLAILIEEVGEVGQALQEQGLGLEEELIQIASVCVRWLEAL